MQDDDDLFEDENLDYQIIINKKCEFYKAIII